MDLTTVTQYRNRIGWIAGFLCLFITLAVLDGLLARFRQPLNLFHLLSGQSEAIHGPVPGPIRTLQDLGYISSSSEIKMDFHSQEKGFWMGTPLWRGEIKLGDRIGPGDYRIRVFVASKGPQPSSPVFLVRVHPDPLTLQTSATSLLRRHFGISPWQTVLWILPGLFLALGVIFWLSQTGEKLLVREGKAEIYRVRRNQPEGGNEIAFGLGTSQGVQAGSCLTLLDDRGKSLGKITVRLAGENDALAWIGPEFPVRPGYWVAKTEAV